MTYAIFIIEINKDKYKEIYNEMKELINCECNEYGHSRADELLCEVLEKEGTVILK